MSMTSGKKLFYGSNYIVVWSCDQSLVTLVFLWEKLSQFCKGMAKNPFSRAAYGSCSVIWD